MLVEYKHFVLYGTNVFYRIYRTVSYFLVVTCCKGSWELDVEVAGENLQFTLTSSSTTGKEQKYIITKEQKKLTKYLRLLCTTGYYSLLFVLAREQFVKRPAADYRTHNK